MPEDEKTSQRFHFYSPTSAAGSRGVYYVPPTFLPRRGCINLRQISQGDGTSPTFKIHSTRHHPTCACGGRGAIEVRRLRRGKLCCVIYHFLVFFPFRRGKLRCAP